MRTDVCLETQFTLWLVVLWSDISCIPDRLFQFLHLFLHCLRFTYHMIWYLFITIVFPPGGSGR